MSEAVVAASAAICIAVLGALLSYASTRRLNRAKARLDRLNAQLQEFYGPLYAIFRRSASPTSSSSTPPTSHPSTTTNLRCGACGPKAPTSTGPAERTR